MHTLSLPSYPSCSLFPSLSLAAHFQIYEFLNIIFLIFPRLRETFSFQTFSFFTSFPPSWVWISQTGCEVTAWPVEVRAGVWGFSVCVRTCACMCVCWGRWKGLRWGYSPKKKKMKRVFAVPNSILNMTTGDLQLRFLRFKDPSCRINRAFEKLLLLSMNVPHFPQDLMLLKDIHFCSFRGLHKYHCFGLEWPYLGRDRGKESRQSLGHLHL